MREKAFMSPWTVNGNGGKEAIQGSKPKKTACQIFRSRRAVNQIEEEVSR
jgi:transketolase C-terminal domain/subunit